MADGRVVLYSIERRQHGLITAWLAGTEIVLPTAPQSRPLSEWGPLPEID